MRFSGGTGGIFEQVGAYQTGFLDQINLIGQAVIGVYAQQQALNARLDARRQVGAAGKQVKIVHDRGAGGQAQAAQIGAGGCTRGAAGAYARTPLITGAAGALGVLQLGFYLGAGIRGVHVLILPEICAEGGKACTPSCEITAWLV